MGHDVSAAGVQLRRRSGRARTRALVGTAPQPGVRHGTRDARARSATDDGRRCAAGSSLAATGADDLAAGKRACGERDVRRIDLQSVGRGVGLDPDRHRADRLVLAEPRGDAQGAGDGEVAVSAQASMQARRRRLRPAPNDGSAVDVRDLPSYGFGDHSLMWWGTWGIILIEGTVFALAAMTYFYLRTRVINWPPSVDYPGLLWGTLNLLIVLLSAIPNGWAKRAGERQDLAGARKWTWVLLAVALVTIAVRFLEFRSLNVRWDSNAYGSIVWTLLGLHTLHLITDAYDTAVLGVLLVTGPLEGKRFGDVAENALYWNFVVIAWVPIYAIIYIAPRVI